MSQLISDEMLEAVAVCCPYDEVASRVLERAGDSADRVSMLAHFSTDPEPWSEIAREINGRG